MAVGHEVGGKRGGIRLQEPLVPNNTGEALPNRNLPQWEYDELRLGCKKRFKEWTANPALDTVHTHLETIERSSITRLNCLGCHATLQRARVVRHAHEVSHTGRRHPTECGGEEMLLAAMHTDRGEGCVC